MLECEHREKGLEDVVTSSMAILIMQIFKDLKKYYKYLIYATKSQLKSEVSNSYLNWFWWVLEPLMDMVVYTIVFGVIFKSQIDSFPVFVFMGITIWGFFSKSLNQSTMLMKNNIAIVSKVYIPKQILLFKVLFVNLFKMAISCGIIVVMFIIYQIPVNICLIYIIPILLELFLLTYGIACILMHFGVYVNDLAYIVSILLNITMFASGIFYSLADKVDGFWGRILLYGNPVAFIINAMRDVTMYRVGVDKLVYLVWLIIAILISIYGTTLVYKNENSYVKAI